MRTVSAAAAAILGLSLLATGACGAEPGKADVRAGIAEKLGIKPGDIRPSPVPGLLEVTSGSEIGYVSEDGRFYVDGEIFDMNSRANLTEERRKVGRVALLAGIKDADAIVFAPRDVGYTITIFTDVDCSYCRKLHSEIAEYNKLGIKVRYLMFPRSGPGTPSWKQAEAVWCSPDRNDALTRAKRGEQIAARACDDPVAKQYELGHEVGVRGTPAIFTEQGDLIAGYLPPQQMIERLKALAGTG